MNDVRKWLRSYVLPSERKSKMNGENQTKEKNPPIKKFKVGNISVNIWQRDHAGKTFYNFNAERSYQDDENEWQSSGSFGYEDIGSLELAMGLAKKYLANLLQSQLAD